MAIAARRFMIQIALWKRSLLSLHAADDDGPHADFNTRANDACRERILSQRL